MYMGGRGVRKAPRSIYARIQGRDLHDARPSHPSSVTYINGFVNTYVG
jgi:hypothetical protein